MLRLSKQANDEIRRLEESRNRNIIEEREKRRITENQDAIEFWIATARHWHKRATFLEGVAQREKDTTTQAVTEMEIQSIERHHWKQTAEQNHGDVMAAERRCDAFGDILDALSRGYVMEPFDGCAKWWRHDTDTLAAIAKAAREREIEKDSKPLPLFGGGAAEVDTTPQQVAALACDPNGKAWTRWEWGYAPNDLPDGAIVEIVTFHGSTNTLEASVIDWEQVKSYRVIQRNPAVDAEHAADPDQSESVTENKADGFNGHMIGTDGDRVGFIRHAMNYGFEPEIGPLERLGTSALGDLYSAAFYYMQNNGHPMKVAE